MRPSAQPRGELVGRKVNKAAKLAEIWELAAQSAALPHAPATWPCVETFRVTLRHYQSLTKLRAELERAEAALSGNADYAMLKRASRASEYINTLTIMAEAGDMRRFGATGQFLKYCGLDLAAPVGRGRGRERLSKRGKRPPANDVLAGRAVAIHPRNSFRDCKYDRYVKVPCQSS